MSDILTQIAAYKRREIAERQARVPLSEVERQASRMPAPRPFRAALDGAISNGRYGLIAEIKKASPSKGLIRADFDPPALARAYASGGATCLSVLTDGPSFQGADADLIAARGAVALPVLRKDFLFEPYQVAEARALGADCILIIMAAVNDGAAAALIANARAYGMDVLVEVHNGPELVRALDLDTRLIGINNRNLRSFETTLATTEHLAPQIPAGYTVVAESGIASPADLWRLAAVGVRAFLVGESLMRSPDVPAATRRLIGEEP